MGLSDMEAISDFIAEHGLEVDPVGNCHFMGIIDYKSPAHATSLVTKVTFVRNGWNDGKIELEERENLSVDEYHLDFRDDYQGYSFDIATKNLIIEGASNKMRGRYIVSIYPE